MLLGSVFVPNATSDLSVTAAGGHILVPSAPEVQQIQKEVVDQRGLVQNNKQQEGRAPPKMRPEL